jgi:ferredoxin-NADP reductase
MPPPYPVPFPINREAGIERYRAMLTPDAHKARIARGETTSLVPKFRMPDGPPPVFPVILKRREDMAEDISRFEFVAANGGDLPKFDAGAHVDVVIAPEYLRQYSLAGNPADTSKYVLGVQREPQGRGGSILMLRAFREGRRVFISPPRNHFPLDENAKKSFLFAGGIGITPMLTMAHRLHDLGRDFELHYSARSRPSAAFISDLCQVPWHNRVRWHMKDEGARADFEALLPAYREGNHLYTCGSPRYMDGLFAIAAEKGWPEDALHREYFTVPEPPDYVNEPFTLKLARSRRQIEIPADKRATDVLAEMGIVVDTKCSDGICGVCAVKVLSGEVEHRDHVLSKKEREQRMILCCSRGAQAGSEIEVDL